ncbi:hypothetical protein HanHA300_Chr05g0175721 [Helianthus annuus]|nr:hypothetical protein HanHA300_Chr05g0175721 [Helianthus annuus]KAJ0747190.1 hypothetical protein HanOQP8_Chr05g0186591 [Helianthus annuus]
MRIGFGRIVRRTSGVRMGIVSAIAGTFGFGIGVSIGLVMGYYFFIYFQPTHVEVCILQILVMYVGGQLLTLDTVNKYVSVI